MDAAAPPLTVPAYHILLALWDRNLHGYAILQDVENRTGGEVRLTASTLYGALARLLDTGLIVELTDGPATDRADSRRRRYRISPDGKRAVRHEALRLERHAAMAREKRILPPWRSSPTRS